MTTSKSSIKKVAVDHRQGQKVIATLSLYDAGQDFTEIDVLENGVILGNSIMFADGRLSMIGIGSVDGVHYYRLADLIESGFKTKALKGLLIYIKETSKATPLPWNAQTLKYEVEKVIKTKDADRFCK